MKCPHCNDTIHANWSDWNFFGDDADGRWFTRQGSCPACRRFLIMYKMGEASGDHVVEWMAYPRSSGRAPVAAAVPNEFASDYREACMVLADSPKASAALSRRCLQHMLREIGGFNERNLDTEIQAAIDSKTLPSYITEALDAVRVVGNFAAHPIKSTASGEIIDVEPGEAEQQLDTVELLFDFYFVQPEIAKKKRDALNAKLAAAGKPPLK